VSEKYHNPRTAAWISNLSWELEPHGRKTALATFLAGERGRPELNQRFKVAIGKYLSGTSSPGCEILLSIDEWLTNNPRTV
jgi:hypothetical protein